MNKAIHYVFCLEADGGGSSLSEHERDNRCPTLHESKRERERGRESWGLYS